MRSYTPRSLAVRIRVNAAAIKICNRLTPMYSYQMLSCGGCIELRDLNWKPKCRVGTVQPHLITERTWTAVV